MGLVWAGLSASALEVGRAAHLAGPRLAHHHPEPVRMQLLLWYSVDTTPDVEVFVLTERAREVAGRIDAACSARHSV
jgi:hypothetical protein